jgi:predicted transcriptional regulator
VNNTRTDPDYFPGSGPNGIEMLSKLCVPIIYEGRVLGTINLESLRFNRFSNKEACTLEAFSKEIAPTMCKLMEEGSLNIKPIGPFFGSNRTGLEMSMDILRVIGCGESVQTKILYAVNVSWKPGTMILRELESKGYITLEHLTDSKNAYRITELGLRELAEYKKIKSLFQ